jgi:hypothetical protein
MLHAAVVGSADFSGTSGALLRDARKVTMAATRVKRKANQGRIARSFTVNRSGD